MKWVECCRRTDLETKTPDQLNKHYRLCAQHFESSMICRSSPYRTVLRDNAIPTIFDLTSHLGHPYSRHRKRIKELSEEEMQILGQQKRDHISEQNLTMKPRNESTVQIQDEVEMRPLTQEEKDNKDYLRILFENLVFMGKQNILLTGHQEGDFEDEFTTDNFQALMDFRINCGDEVLRKRFEMTAVNVAYCNKDQLIQMLEICGNCVREDVIREIRDAQFFSINIDEVVNMADEVYLPVFGRFVDESNNLREELLGFVPYDTDADLLASQFHLTITEKWGLNMENCRGLAYVPGVKCGSNMKAVVNCLLEKNPKAVISLSSSCALNIWLAKSMHLPGVSSVLGTMQAICVFFHLDRQLLPLLHDTITELFQNNVEKGNELKLICRSDWASRHDSFDILVDLLQSLVISFEKILDEASVKWNVNMIREAHMLLSEITIFKFVVSAVVLKNALSFTRAFGKNLQGLTSDVFFASGSLTAVLHSLNEVMENIEVYHEFWFEEATNIATKLDIEMKLPRNLLEVQQQNEETDMLIESYFKETLSIPIVETAIRELKDIFSEQHLKALKCLSLVPSVMGQLKFSTNEEQHSEMYKTDLPNPDTLSAELHCWRIKWKHRGKDVALPTNINEALHLPDMKFFPNMYALLKVLCILPVMKVEHEKYEIARKRMRTYLRDTPRADRSTDFALLNINYDIKVDLDLMVDTYVQLYGDKVEDTTPLSNSEENNVA
ncbi:52 kDa repressor of the inhibitor of the protein kinase isoform X2 [Ambystoma mexicanum]